MRGKIGIIALTTVHKMSYTEKKSSVNPNYLGSYGTTIFFGETGAQWPPGHSEQSDASAPMVVSGKHLFVYGVSSL